MSAIVTPPPIQSGPYQRVHTCFYSAIVVGIALCAFASFVYDLGHLHSLNEITISLLATGSILFALGIFGFVFQKDREGKNGLDLCKSYILKREDCFYWTFRIKEKGLIILSQSNHQYQFNRCEKLGNALLLPMDKILREWVDSNRISKKIFLVFLSIFIVIPTFLGLLTKKIGEMINPCGHLRARTYVLQEQIEEQRYKILGVCCSFLGGSLDVLFACSNSKFNEKILKGKFQVTSEELQQITSFGPPPANSSTQFQELQHFVTKWNKTWQNIALKILNYEDLSELEDEIISFVIEDKELVKTFRDHFNNYRLFLSTHEKWKRTIQDYTQIQTLFPLRADHIPQDATVRI